MQLFDEVNTGEGANGRSGEVNNSNEEQRPAGRTPDRAHVFDRKKPDNDVRQACGSAHEGRGDTEHIHRRHLTRGVFTKS